MFPAFSLGLLLAPYAAAQTIGEVTQTWRVPQAYPEGIAYDKANKRILLSSVTSNKIMTLDPAKDMAVQTVYTPDTENPSSLGLKVDESTGQVWVTTTDLFVRDYGGVALYDMPVSDSETATAQVMAQYTFPCTVFNSKNQCLFTNDLVIVNGLPYVADSVSGLVYKIENDTVKMVSNDPLLYSDNIGPNGILYDERGFLIVASSSNNSLVRIDLATNEAMAIPIEGGEIAGGIAFPDGLLMDSSGRMIISNGGNTISVLKDNDDEWKSAVVEGTVDIDHKAEGENVATIAFGETENEIYVTYVRFGDLEGEGGPAPNQDPSLLVKVTLFDSIHATTATVGATVAPGTDATNAPEAGATEALTSEIDEIPDDSSSASVKAVGIVGAIAAGLTAMLF